MKKSAIPEVWTADLYTRLSREDRDRKDESNSIKNQRDLLLDFVSRNPDICVANILADDGATGADFDRKDFKTMIRHIEDGDVNCIIVKDFSRLGRDHIETGKYIERYFAAKGVRFISVNDNYDSLKSDMSDGANGLIVPFKNIINEAFLEDISVKTRSQLEIKRKNGEFVCNYAVYGYLKSGEKTLVVDEYAADVVRAIFESKIRGVSEGLIAEKLNSTGILSPAGYKESRGISYCTPFSKQGQPSLWTANAVKRILTNRVYTGVLEQGKRTKASYRVKKTFYKPREAWSVHENNHEPIVSEADFTLVQGLMKKDTRTPPGAGTLHLFSGYVVCGKCGQPMIVKTTTKSNGKSYVYYICATHKKHGTCGNNSVSEAAIELFALESIRKQIAGLIIALEIEGGGIDSLQGKKRLAVEGMIEDAMQSIREQQSYLVKSYEHFVDGVITGDEYRVFKDGFHRRIESSERNIANLRRDLENTGDDARTREMIEHFKSHGNITALDRRAVVTLIDSVIVYDNKTLEIRLRYLSDFDTPLTETEAM
jgi:DNA invertase Pin-like site-specific DNA recombinase